MTQVVANSAVSSVVQVAGPALSPLVSVVVPTFREAANIPELVERIEKCIDRPELVIVDDNSNDGTEQVVAALGREWVRLLVRRDERGLSSAVIAGCKLANGPTIVVMDADLSHPPEAIPAMLGAMKSGHDFVLGSRYVNGGTTDSAWTLFRRVNSLVATALAKPLTNLADPMSGFFAMSRNHFQATTNLNPIGYKIALEMLVKGPFKRPTEVPIHFADRKRGESKLSLKEQARYVRHVLRLYRYRMLGW